MLGKLAYRFFFRPTFSVRYHLSHFGLKGWFAMLRGERHMKKAARKLVPINLTSDKLLEVNFLTGKKYWHQTIFCAYSLAKVLDGRVGIKLYSDGSLTRVHVKFINQVLCGIEWLPEAQVIENLDKLLPRDKFPTLRQLREWHPFFRRIIDIHSDPSWAIHLDSDMLFKTRPENILDAYQNKSAVYMKEQLPNSYFVDTEQALKSKHGINCAERVNGGIIAYDSKRVDYADLEEKAVLLMKHYPDAGPAQVEQTLMSYLLYQQDACALNEHQYVIFYDRKLDLTHTQIIRHYIFKAKLPYLTSEWKSVLL